jgi:hypothetical protein
MLDGHRLCPRSRCPSPLELRRGLDSYFVKGHGTRRKLRELRVGALRKREKDLVGPVVLVLANGTEITASLTLVAAHPARTVVAESEPEKDVTLRITGINPGCRVSVVKYLHRAFDMDLPDANKIADRVEPGRARAAHMLAG